MRTNLIISAVFIVCVLSLAALSEAAEVKYVKLPGRYKAGTVTLNASAPKPSKVVFYISSPGNDTERYEVTVSSNAAIIGTLSYKMVKGSTLAANAAAQSRGWIPLKVYYDYKSRKTLNVGKLPNARPTPTPKPAEKKDPSCGCLTESVIDTVLGYQHVSREVFCRSVNEDLGGPFESCDGTSGPDEGDDSGGITPSETKEGYGIIEKNACSRNPYLLKIEIPLNTVTQAQLAKGVTISAKAKFTDFNPPKQIILKRSDGGLFPNAPIALLPYISAEWPGGDRCEVIFWKGTKIKNRINLTSGDMMLYAGYHRLLIGSLFTGQKATFQVVAPFPSGGSIWTMGITTAAYGRCFRLIDQRQVSN